MQIQVQFFSNLKELMGGSTRLIEIPQGSHVSDLLDVIYARAPSLGQEYPHRLVVVVRMRMIHQAISGMSIASPSLMISFIVIGSCSTPAK